MAAMRNLLLPVLALGLLAALGVPADAANCSVSRDQHVRLFGPAEDPDVLVWDSKMRLVEYSADSVTAISSLMPHAMLAHPGTYAVVERCEPGVVHARYHFATDDAIAIRITSGRYRGRYGWVKSSDIFTRSSDSDDW